MLSPFPLVVLAMAALLHGLTGMGFPLIATPTLGLFLSLPTALAVLAIPTLFLNLLVILGKKNSTPTPIRPYLPLIISSIVGSIIGVKLLFLLPISYMNGIMAMVILYYAIQGLLSLFGLIKPLTVPTGNLSMLSFGLASGLIGGATNAMSPILLMYLFSKTNNKNDIARISNLCYLSAKLIQIALLWQEFKNFSPTLWGLTALISLISMVAVFVGIALRDKISQTFFKALIYIILLALGIKIAYILIP